MCCCSAFSNVANRDFRQAVIIGPHPLAFTTGRDVKEALHSGQGKLALFLINYIRVGMDVSDGFGWKALANRKSARPTFMDSKPSGVNH